MVSTRSGCGFSRGKDEWAGPGHQDEGEKSTSRGAGPPDRQKRNSADGGTPTSPKSPSRAHTAPTALPDFPPGFVPSAKDRLELVKVLPMEERLAARKEKGKEGDNDVEMDNADDNAAAAMLNKRRPKSPGRIAEEAKYVWFWKARGDNGWASQWYPQSFPGPARLGFPGEAPLFRGEQPTHKFHTAENFMMFHKAVLFKDFRVAEQILWATDPKDVKTLGRMVSNFDENVWNAHCDAIVEAGTRAKFTSSRWLASKLLGTGDKILVEASPFDKIWGIGYTQEDALDNVGEWGQNKLGIALMTIRDELRRKSRK